MAISAEFEDKMGKTIDALKKTILQSELEELTHTS